MKRKLNNSINLLSGDVDALLSALDLVANADSGNDAQNQLNYLNCQFAATKLKNHADIYSANELRVIYTGIGFALDLLSGTENPYLSVDELTPEWRDDLKRNIFIYNRLYPHFEKLISDIERNL